MKFEINTWTIKELIDAYNNDILILNPPYQRNYIWSLSDQRTLIESISKGHPIPNFFLLKKDNGKYEIVDGQQRTRTILGYYTGLFSNKNNRLFDAEKDKGFLDYQFPVTILSEIDPNESIEKFYSMVNGSGIHLNRPEIMTAEFYDTKLLTLVNELASSKVLKSLDLFTAGSLKRMNDIDFISELVVLLKDGHTDTKLKVDQAFVEDITNKDYNDLRTEFNRVFEVISRFNEIFPVKKTRYKQRNDLYTLVSFIHQQKDLLNDSLDYFYKVLVLIGSDIRPTQDKCKPFKEYAINCVTQSNSKTARDERYKFFKNVLLNSKNKPNSVQKDILKYFGITNSELKKVQKYWTLDISKLADLKSLIEFDIV